MRKSITPLVLVLCTLVGSVARAQEITFNASVDRNSIATGDAVKLTITLTQAPVGSSMSAPPFGGLTVLQGPYPTSSNSIFNGHLTSSVSYTWFLTATQPGDYTIGAASARVGRGSLQTDPIIIHVTKGATTGPNTAQLEQAQKTDPNLFCTISLSKNKVYVGEQIIATYTLYSRYNSLRPGDYDWPKLNGFWAEEVQTSDQQKQQTVNGLTYLVVVLKQQVLIPQRSGKLPIDAVTLNYFVSSGFFSVTEVRTKSAPAMVTVMELPPGKPADFMGGVGDLKMEVTAAATTVKANEAIDLTVRFTGRANLKLIDAPKLNFPGDFESYDPKITDKITVNGSGMNGTREFQYLVIPRHEGDYDIGAVNFSYFDPATGQYKQLHSDPLNFHVEKGDANSSATVSRPNRTDVQQVGTDIRYIRTGDLALVPVDHHLFGSWPYLAGMLAPALGFLLFFGWKRKRDQRLSDTQGLRRRGADKVAKQRLRAAEEALKANDRTGFYDALGKALEGYFADKFNLGVAEVNATMVNEKLGAIDGGKVAKDYAALMSDSEMARFAPFENKPRQQSYDEAAALIRRIEDQIRA